VRITVSTYFDITETGVSRPYKGQPLPAKVGKTTVHTAEEWNIKRRQQNNLVTVMQCLSMRGTPEDITSPVLNKGVWSFSFDVNDPLVYGNDLEFLTQDTTGIPMTVGLTETHEVDAYLNENNIWFEADV
jgi:hypothetical protein